MGCIRTVRRANSPGSRAEERKRIVKIVCEQAAGRVPVLAGAAEANVRETILACETYAGYGARAVAIVSPFYYKLCPESVHTYFKEIALNSPIDITLYNIPMFASPIDVPTIRRLAEFERVIGIKDSSGDLAFMMRMMSAVRPVRPDFVFMTGWEAVLVPMLVVGCDGGTNATSGVAPELTRKLYDLTRAGRIEEAMRLQFRLLELFDAMLLFGRFPGRFPRRRGTARFSRGPQPPAAKRRAKGRFRGIAEGVCNASSPISAMSMRPPRVVRRGPESSKKTASRTSPRPSCSNCTERGAI